VPIALFCSTSFFILAVSFLALERNKRASTTIIIVFSALAVLLQVLDSHSTWAAIQKWGPTTEDNEYARSLFAMIGFWPTSGLKLIFAGIVCAISFYLKITAILTSHNIVFGCIIISNYWQFYV